MMSWGCGCGWNSEDYMLSERNRTLQSSSVWGESERGGCGWERAHRRERWKLAERCQVSQRRTFQEGHSQQRPVLLGVRGGNGCDKTVGCVGCGWGAVRRLDNARFKLALWIRLWDNKGKPGLFLVNWDTGWPLRKWSQQMMSTVPMLYGLRSQDDESRLFFLEVWPVES